MDLRDRFAAHFAAALVDAFADPADVARRAYDLAEAMLLERARRAPGDEVDALLAQLPLAYHGALLDEPEPLPESSYDDELDPRWLDPPYDPAWDLEARWSADEVPLPPVLEGGSRPGLARTRPEEEEEERRARQA
jgi:hypothetical protein